MNFNDTQHINMTSPGVVESGVKMGLGDKPCTDPKYFCTCHKVYLSDQDVKLKRCRCKPTFDMIGYTNCKYLYHADEYEAMISTKNQIIANNRKQNFYN